VDLPEGMLHDDEEDLLYDLAKACTGRGVIVEIGSYKGRSTICLGMGSLEGNKVPIYAIDPHDGRDPHDSRTHTGASTLSEFLNNVHRAGLDDIIHPIVDQSENVASSFALPVELLFIDGDHAYESVQRDFSMWAPKVIENGVIALHDTRCYEGPRKIAAEKMYRSRQFSHVRWVTEISYGKKVIKNKLPDYYANLLVLGIGSAMNWKWRTRLLWWR